MRRPWAILIALAISMVTALTTAADPVQAADPPTPRVFFAPSGVLTDAQTILVGGDGFTPSVPVWIYECAAGDCVPVAPSLVTDGSGRFGLAITVRRGIEYGGTEFDCAFPRCYLVATTTAGEPENMTNATTASAPIDFGSRPTMTVAPDTRLEDGQTVTVAGEHFVPGQRVSAFECQDYGNLCTRGLGVSAVVDAQGRVALTAQVVRWIHDYMDDAEDPPFDCAVNTCRLSLALTSGEYEDGYFSLALHQLEFAPRPSLASGNAQGYETATGIWPVTVTVAISPAPRQPTRIGYRTLEWSAHAQDFEPALGTMTVPAGATQFSVTVNVRDDTLREGYEAFLVEFQGTGRFRKAHTVAVVWINDNDFL